MQEPKPTEHAEPKPTVPDSEANKLVTSDAPATKQISNTLGGLQLEKDWKSTTTWDRKKKKTSRSS